ncbi:acetolactate synthase, small subunit [Desulfovibrio sp. X2]|uniref:acetolactate synthase small subunit n=1 Tax=Desulfovibrio sp. X2 TaxID=941449 RepID=UPI0003589919|nr:acetolactate synthase small subunit [Desulfovibrio sp. X2]EPR43359.1 acetolactate synthase, small subunit [Desulfovibrio sp. X2]
MKHTISALVRNRPGVLAELALMFKEEKLNIKSIAAGETEDPEVTRLVICLDAEGGEVELVTEKIAGMDWVLQVDDLARKEFVDRELLLVKVRMDRENLTQLMQIFEVFRASVVGMGQESITVEMAGDQERVEGLVKLLKPFGIKSLCRSGMIALKRGDE